MDSLQEYLAQARPELREPLLAWAESNKVDQATLVRYCFNSNTEFAAALGVLADFSADLWAGLNAHSAAWQQYRQRQEGRAALASPCPSPPSWTP